MAIGLHLTKCAGTSLITTIRSNIADGTYYFCSSYYENMMDGRLLFDEILAPDKLQFVFGHFVHESSDCIFC